MQSRGVNCVRTTSPRITNQTTNHYKYSNDRTTNDQTLEASYYYVLDFQPRCNQVSQQQSTVGAFPEIGLFFGAVDCFLLSPFSPRISIFRCNDTRHLSSRGSSLTIITSYILLLSTRCPYTAETTTDTAQVTLINWIRSDLGSTADTQPHMDKLTTAEANPQN